MLVRQSNEKVIERLGGNYLTVLPAEIGSLSKLRNLYLSDNNIHSLPPEIGNVIALDESLLDANAITDPDLLHLGSLSSLRWLNLQKTKVSNEAVVEHRRRLPQCHVLVD